MNRRLWSAAVLMALCPGFGQGADVFSSYIKHRFSADDIQMHEVQSLKDRITDGKLHLRIRDFIELMLKNSADVQLTRLDVYTAANNILSSNSPFDPFIGANFSAQRSVTPLSFTGGFSSTGTGTGTGTGTSTGTGTGTGGSTGQGGTGTGTGSSGGNLGGGSFVVLPQTISSLSQNSSLNYSQLLPTGQIISSSFNGIRSSGDEYPFPAVFGSLNFQITQPLLQNRTNLQNKGPRIIARTQLLVSSEQSEATIGDSVATAARQYWDAVQARDTIHVQQQTLNLAQKSYERDKLALDLGALASLDIYQSQTQVAERQRDLVDAQFRYRTALDGLRRFVGADLTPELRSTEIVLDDDAAVTPPRTDVLPFEAALAKAVAARPEFKATDQRLSIDDVSARVARDALRPQLNVTASGGSSGPAFNQVATGGSVGIPATPYPGYGETLKQVLQFSFPSYGIRAQLNFPLRNSTAKAQLSDALVSRVQDRYRKRVVQQTITLDVRQAIDNIELADASIGAANTARDLARKNVDAEQQKYQLGTVTAFELLDSQSRLANAESAVLNAYVLYQEAYVNYQRATWTLLDGFGVIVDVPKVP